MLNPRDTPGRLIRRDRTTLRVHCRTLNQSLVPAGHSLRRIQSLVDAALDSMDDTLKVSASHTC